MIPIETAVKDNKVLRELFLGSVAFIDLCTPAAIEDGGGEEAFFSSELSDFSDILKKLCTRDWIRAE